MPLRESLWALHLVDTNLSGLRRRLDSATRRRDALQTRLDQFQRQAQELDHRLRLQKAHVATLESEASGQGERVDELREKMNAVTNNKQYSAMLVEVNTLKVEKAKVEDQALKEMGEVEELQAKFDAQQAKTNEQQGLVNSAEEEIVEARSEIGDRLKELESEREVAVKEVPDDTLRLYNKLLDDYRDEDEGAVAAIQVQDRKRMEYNCSGCYTLLPIERVNVAISQADALVVCPSCGRILVAGKELQPAAAES